ncbi:uncharacterized protein TNCV_1154061, partial [Trichonephila clavipes]
AQNLETGSRHGSTKRLGQLDLCSVHVADPPDKRGSEGGHSSGRSASDACPSSTTQQRHHPYLFSHLDTILHLSSSSFFGLEIHQNDLQARRRFVEWAQNEIAIVPDFHKRILFSDEAHFWLNGYVSKQNCRIWSEANPQVYVETPLHPEKLTVWCALWAGGIIGPYFFKNDDGHNVTVNGDRYRALITNFFIPELNNHDVQELWFQQDGATCHTARATIDLLKDTFGDRLISRFEPVNWPPRSCDLTPLDYFLWGYVKSLVYADKPQTLDHLEDNIRRVIADIRPKMLEKVIENWTSRLDYIRVSRGSHMPEIIFKMEGGKTPGNVGKYVRKRHLYEQNRQVIIHNNYAVDWSSVMLKPHISSDMRSEKLVRLSQEILITSDHPNGAIASKVPQQIVFNDSNHTFTAK